MAEIAAALKSFEGIIDVKFNEQLQATKNEMANIKWEIANQISATSDEIKNDLLKMRETLIDNLIKENKILQKSVSVLYSRLINVERQANQTEQNNRKSNLEIDGIPASVVNENLKSVVTEILNRVADSEISERDIEAVHRLPSKSLPQPTIVRMRRDLIDECKLKDNKAKLSNIPAAINSLAGSRLYINDNLSPNMRTLAYNARLLKRAGVIMDTWFANAAVRVRRHDKSILKVTHEIDLVDEFPGFPSFTFDASIYGRNTDDDSCVDDDADMNRYDTLEGSWENYYPPNHKFARSPSANIVPVMRTPEFVDKTMATTGSISNSVGLHEQGTSPGKITAIGTPKPNLPPKPNNANPPQTRSRTSLKLDAAVDPSV